MIRGLVRRPLLYLTLFNIIYKNRNGNCGYILLISNHKVSNIQSLGLACLLFAHLDVTPEHNVPELAADAKSDSSKLVMVLHVVQFHVLKVTRLWGTVVHEVVHLVVDLVTD